MFLENLVDDEARNSLRQRFPAAKSCTEFDGFPAMLASNKINRELLASYADADLLYEDLRKANHLGLLGKIKQYYEALRTLKEGDPLIPFRTALEEALRRLSEQSDLNARRVSQIFAEPDEP